jgi:hypothetical protein
MSLLVAWIVMAVLALGAAVITVLLVRSPMRDLLGANSILTATRRFFVRAFGLTWEDCEALLRKLGYSTHIEVTSD